MFDIQMSKTQKYRMLY